MEVQFAPEIEERLNAMAAQSGRVPSELVQDAVAGYVSEAAALGAMLDTRYDDIKTGRVKLLDGEEAFARLHANIEARRNRPA